MKSRISSVVSPALIFGLGSILPFAQAQDGPVQLGIHVDFIEVSSDQATQLASNSEHPKSSTDGQALKKSLLSSDSARLYASTSVLTKSGQRATAQSVAEVIYATEFDPAKGRAENAPEEPRDITGVDIPTPTSLEMRAVGITVEVDPVLGADGETIDLNLAPEIVEQIGEDVIQEIPLGSRTMTTIKQPRFYVMKVQTSITITDGGTQWIGTLQPRTDEGVIDPDRRILVFVTARIIKS